MADELDVDDLKAWMYEKAKLQCSPLVKGIKSRVD